MRKFITPLFPLILLFIVSSCKEKERDLIENQSTFYKIFDNATGSMGTTLVPLDNGGYIIGSNRTQWDYGNNGELLRISPEGKLIWRKKIEHAQTQTFLQSSKFLDGSSIFNGLSSNHIIKVDPNGNIENETILNNEPYFNSRIVEGQNGDNNLYYINCSGLFAYNTTSSLYILSRQLL